MTETGQNRIKPATIVLFVLAIVTALLGVVVVLAYLSRPKPVTLTISEPVGGVVLCDLVIDGRAEQHRDTVPVTYTHLAESLRFAVIPETAGAGSVEIEMSASHGGGTMSGAGVSGEIQTSAWSSSSRASVMTRRHVASMRAARLSPTRPDDVRRGTSSTQ